MYKFDKAIEDELVEVIFMGALPKSVYEELEIELAGGYNANSKGLFYLNYDQLGKTAATLLFSFVYKSNH